MIKFKAGDICKVKKGHEHVCNVFSKYEHHEGVKIKITDYNFSDGYCYDILDNNDNILNSCYFCFGDDDIYKDGVEDYKNNNKINMFDKFATMFLSEPEKTFRKAGIINGDNVLTEDGKKIFLSWLLKKYGTEFKSEVVDELVKEDK